MVFSVEYSVVARYSHGINRRTKVEVCIKEIADFQNRSSILCRVGFTKVMGLFLFRHTVVCFENSIDR